MEVAKRDLGLATSVLATFLGLEPILLGATERQLDRLVPKLVEGAIWAYGVTEPNAGSDFSAIKATAVPTERQTESGTEKGYLINGSKIFISNGNIADGLTILARTPNGKPSFFWVEIERNADGEIVSPAGLTTNPLEAKIGQHLSDTAEISLEDLFVPIENLVGEAEGLGAEQGARTFDYTRLMVASFGAAAGLKAVEMVMAYGQERVQFGGPLTNQQGYTDRLIVPHATRLAAAQAYIEQIAEQIDRGKTGLAMEGSMVKVLATEAGSRAIDAAIQGHGGYGYMHEYPPAQLWLDARVLRIYEGATEALLPSTGVQLFRSAERVYGPLAEEMDQLAVANSQVGAEQIAGAARALLEAKSKLGRQISSRRKRALASSFAELASEISAAAALARKAARVGEEAPDTLEAQRLAVSAQIFSSTVAEESLARFWGEARRLHLMDEAADLLLERDAPAKGYPPLKGL
jgi:alkylation response protein AidB-like acyl-CoA dehydrogenase